MIDYSAQYTVTVLCPDCNKEFPITEQDTWSGLCPECVEKAREKMREKYLKETGEEMKLILCITALLIICFLVVFELLNIRRSKRLNTLEKISFHHPNVDVTIHTARKS